MRVSDRTRVMRALAALLGGIVAVPAPLRAQMPHSPSCSPTVLDAALDTVPADHPASLRARLEQRLKSRDVTTILAVLDSLARTYRAFAPVDEVPDIVVSRFASELDSTLAEVAAVRLSSDPVDLISRSAVINIGRFTPSRGAGVGYRLFARSGDLGLEVRTIDEAAQRAVCGRALVMHAALDLYGTSGRERVAAELRRKATRWRNYHRNMPTQYPWELALNGLATDRPLLEPPRTQWLLLHPTVAGEIAGSRLDALDRREVAAMEWIGRSWSDDELRRSFGLSVLSTFPKEAPASIGVMARFGRSLAVGVVTRRVDGRAQVGGVMSLDLYRIVTNGGPAEVKAAVKASATRAAAATDATIKP